MWTAGGRRSCAASTSSTPSGCSSRPSAGPHRRSATPTAADRWTWLLIAAHTQLRLARPLVADLRRPWERPAATGATHPGPGPPRVSEHPPDNPAPRPRTQTQPTRPRTPTRLPQPTPRDQPRRGQNGQTRPDHHRTTKACRLKIKLSDDVQKVGRTTSMVHRAELQTRRTPRSRSLSAPGAAAMASGHLALDLCGQHGA